MKLIKLLLNKISNKKNENIKRITQTYKQSPIRPLVQLLNYKGIPVGSMGDVLIDTVDNAVTSHINEKNKQFLDALNSTDLTISKDMIDDHDFIHAFYSTYRAAVRTKTKKKITLFANLFANGVNTKLISKADEYDYYLTILDELSLTEVMALEILLEYEVNADFHKGEVYFWPEFYEKLKSLLSVNKNKEVDSFLERLIRTGCYQKVDTAKTFSVINRNMDSDVPKAPQGYVTPIFHKLKELIQYQGGNLANKRKNQNNF